MKSVIKGAGYILVHTPDMVIHNGTTQTTERIVNPESEYLKELPSHIRTFEQVLSYYPNQVYIGNQTPDDLAVIGFDVSDIYQLYSTSVTHIVQPLKALGEKSVEVLVNMIQGKPAESVILKPEMVEGNSTAAKK